MLTTVPQQDTGDLDQPQIVGGLLLVAHQNGAAFREPAQCALHHPSPRRVTLLPGAIFLLLADAPYVGGVAAGLHCLLDLRSLVVALVQAQMLGRPLRGLGALDHHGVERGFEQLEVRYVRPSHYDSQRPSPGLHQQGALHPVFASIGGIGAYEVPPKRALPLDPSAACHSKSTPPSSSHSSMSLSQMRSSTPSSTHLCKVRCTEESSGNSFGKRFHWQPLLILKMIASRASRRSMRGRPVLFGGSCFSRIGSMISHSSSGTRQMVGSSFTWVGVSVINTRPLPIVSSALIYDRRSFEIVSKRAEGGIHRPCAYCIKYSKLFKRSAMHPSAWKNLYENVKR